MINIMLVEDHNIVRSGIKILLESDPAFNIVCEATNGLEALAQLQEDCTIDIVLTDINMEEMDGISLLKEIKKDRYASIKVVILSMHDNEKYVLQAFEAGASGYILKSVSAQELKFALRFIADGHLFVCSEVVSKLITSAIANRSYHTLNENLQIDFSEREMEVLHLIADGYTNTEMADKLFISKRTVEGHRQSLIDKTKTKNTAALIKFGVLNGLIH